MCTVRFEYHITDCPPYPHPIPAVFLSPHLYAITATFITVWQSSTPSPLTRYWPLTLTKKFINEKNVWLLFGVVTEWKQCWLQIIEKNSRTGITFGRVDQLISKTDIASDQNFLTCSKTTQNGQCKGDLRIFHAGYHMRIKRLLLNSMRNKSQRKWRNAEADMLKSAKMMNLLQHTANVNVLLK